MSEKTAAFFIGMGVCALIAAFIPGSIVRAYHRAIEECEAALPRNQECVITAVPDISGKQ